jgi:hypothetical protein
MKSPVVCKTRLGIFVFLRRYINDTYNRVFKDGSGCSRRTGDLFGRQITGSGLAADEVERTG